MSLMFVMTGAVSAATTLFEDDFGDDNLFNGGWIGDYLEEPDTEGIVNDADTTTLNALVVFSNN